MIKVFTRASIFILSYSLRFLNIHCLELFYTLYLWLVLFSMLCSFLPYTSWHTEPLLCVLIFCLLLVCVSTHSPEFNIFLFLISFLLPFFPPVFPLWINPIIHLSFLWHTWEMEMLNVLYYYKIQEIRNQEVCLVFVFIQHHPITGG